MRLASVMFVMDVIQPVCWPRESTSGETVHARVEHARRPSASPSTSMPPAGLRPCISCCSRRAFSSTRSGGQYGNRGRPPDQFVLGKTGHRAERRVDEVMRPSLSKRAHAGQHRVLHRAPEVGLLHQRVLDLAGDAARGARCPTASTTSASPAPPPSRTAALPTRPTEVRQPIPRRNMPLAAGASGRSTTTWSAGSRA